MLVSGDGVMLSLKLDHVFVEEYTIRNKLDGIVECKLRPRSC